MRVCVCVCVVEGLHYCLTLSSPFVSKISAWQGSRGGILGLVDPSWKAPHLNQFLVVRIWLDQAVSLEEEEEAAVATDELCKKEEGSVSL